MREAEQLRVVAPARSEPPPLPVAKIGFRNRRAVVVSLLVAMLTLMVMPLLVSVIPPAFIALPLFGLAGFLAAFLYSRQSGEQVSAQGGARIGFMTALWLFLVIVVLMAIVLTVPDVRNQMMEQISAQTTPETQALLKMFQDPRQFATLLGAELVIVFVLVTLPSIVGGILGV